MTKPEDSWAARVRAWRASGLSAERFAQGKGYAGSALRYRAGKVLESGGVDQPPHVTLRRLVRTSAPPAAAFGAQVLVQVGGVSITVSAGFDPVLVRALVRCLAEEAAS